jgi:PKD repeat protein
MTTIVLSGRTRSAGIALAASLFLAGCSLEKDSPPAVTGPSEFGLSVGLTATPNEVSRDGLSQSVVTITVRDAQGSPVAGQRLNLTLPVNVPSGTTLSSSSVTTDANGRATVTVTAPIRDSIGNSIDIRVTPVGSNLDGVIPRELSISVTPRNTSRPVPGFTFNPISPEIGQLVQFNASDTRDEGLPCNDACNYSWDFGGEASATGRIATYRFRAAGTYVVALTVTDSQGATETARQNVTVSSNGLPTVTLTASGDFRVGRPVRFDANTTVAANHRIVIYEWSFGDGTTATTTAPSVQHTYSSNGLYIARVTVRDDLGQTAQDFEEVEIGTGTTAEFTFEPAIAGEATTFDASRSVAEGGATIRLYTWSWGDASPTESTTSRTIDHTFVAPGNPSVTLTITDSEGRTAQRTRTVPVQPAPAP